MHPRAPRGATADEKAGCVIGGPPCQALSLSNRNAGARDALANLPENYAAVLKELAMAFELDFFVFENVLGLRYKKHAELFGVFKKLFASGGFSIFEGEMDAQDFGVPQVRKRLFVVGFNKKRRNIQISILNSPQVIGKRREPCRTPSVLYQNQNTLSTGYRLQTSRCIQITSA